VSSKGANLSFFSNFKKIFSRNSLYAARIFAGFQRASNRKSSKAPLDKDKQICYNEKNGRLWQPLFTENIMNENDKELNLSEAYQAYFNTIRRYVVSRLHCDTSLAEEACSDVFFLLQSKWDELSSHQPRLILTWLYRTANYVMCDYRRKTARYSTQEWEIALKEYAANEDDVQRVQEQYDYELLLQKIKHRLKEKDRLLFEAIYIEKLPTETLAQQLHISTAAVYLRKARLDRKLRLILRENKNF
jgi:RNA polymerase sigma factor (sigma-70 family)